ncbi:tyrosine-type recombinase/integrase [Thauera humireducens]|uniref:tyrosine-type recombinase/integrase n=1 Tax=Thauera humireducens TaxID=1134435 RepID=UPI0006721B22|nr:site-specific integrase [Thauera humireducens]
MANLEYIHYVPHRVEVIDRKVTWVLDTTIKVVDRLPQIYWRDGRPWREANLWSLEMARTKDQKLATIRNLFEHLHKYADWLESTEADWRHFPKLKASRVIVRYRGALVEQRDQGTLAPSTTTARMRAVIRFYRYAAARGFIGSSTPLWQDRSIIVHYYDSVGFERTIQRVTTDISIPNRPRPGLILEDGLLPLTEEHMSALISFARENTSSELYLILLIGFYTGARLGTILSFTTTALESAIQDPHTPGMWVLPVGPGTQIATKFDVSGELMIPNELMSLLRQYATSRRRLDRAIKSEHQYKRLLFLTRFNRPYKPSSIGREMVDLRRKGRENGLKFLQKFHFHQTRATFGTWLMSLCLKVANHKAALEFVRQAMLHKNASTTFRYIQFIEHTEAKIQVANAFTETFLCLKEKIQGK